MNNLLKHPLMGTVLTFTFVKVVKFENFYKSFFRPENAIFPVQFSKNEDNFYRIKK